MPTRYGRRFYKLTGSGNDFVFVDARAEPAGVLEQPRTVDALCARGTGIGADGLVFLDPPTSPHDRFSIRYFNRDGSLASLCGNASLCSVRLAVELGIVAAEADFTFGTGAGTVRARLAPHGPEIDLQPVAQIRDDAGFTAAAGERRLGFAMVGVPHVVVLCESVDRLDVVARGRPIRENPSLEAGANVNFVARDADGWSLRTYERGVEAETLACGTGAVATAVLLERWGESGPVTTLRTRSGLPLTVRSRETALGRWTPSLSGEGRIVYRGELAL